MEDAELYTGLVKTLEGFLDRLEQPDVLETERDCQRALWRYDVELLIEQATEARECGTSWSSWQIEQGRRLSNLYQYCLLTG